MRRSLLVLALFAVALVGGAVHEAGAGGTAPTFNQNLLLPNSQSAAEPSIRVDSHGAPFVIAPTGVPAGCKAWRVAHDGSSAAYLGFPDSTLGGGDCDWAFAPQETGGTGNDLAYSSLTLPNITTGKSDDNGATWSPPNVFSQQVAGDDRMWMAADPQLNANGHGTIYMTYHDVSLGEIELGVSTDGGVTYTQNSPVINPLDVPTAQWSSVGGVGNELGNIVAHRDASGLKLYSIFETPDSGTDSVAQNAAGTTNFNRVYEAVGTVTYAPDGVTPIVSWHDYEIFHGPVGARLNRIFPVTAVDSAGHVYAIWTDGNHIYFKSDSDGTHWDATAAPKQLDQLSGMPAGYNTALMPWAMAGGNGMVDVVWYAASGGAGAQPAPNDDPANKWVVWMAQTLDGGSTWSGAQASDHVIHTGSICIDGLACNTSTPARDRTLLDFFQVDVDPTTGAADIAYADDHASPGSPVVYFTRQCTGSSATTGVALTNDCAAPAAPAPLPQGTTCPGPQVVDAAGDAPNSYPGGDGSNIDSLDILNASVAPGSSASQLDVTLTLKDLNGPPPPVNLPAGMWLVHWTFNGTEYAVEASSNGGAVTEFSVGTVDASGNYTSSASITGTYTAGADGTIVWQVPRSDVGNPGSGDTLTKTWAETHGAISADGNGLFYTALADRAPNSGYGSDVQAGGCASSTTTTTTSTTTTATTSTTTPQATTTAPAAAPSGGGSSSGGGGSSSSGIPPDLHVAVQASASTAPAVGGGLDFTVKVTSVNSGGSSDARLDLTLPDGYTVSRVSADRGPGCTGTAPHLSCDVGWINPSASTTVVVVGTVGTAGTQRLTATVTSLQEPEANPADNTVTLEVPAAAAATTTTSGGVAGKHVARVHTVRGHGLVGKGRLAAASFAIGARSLVYRSHGLVLRAAIGRVGFSAHSARITGVGRLNGRRVRFAVVAVDRGSRGDLFRIAWNGGPSHGGLLRKGGITVT